MYRNNLTNILQDMDMPYNVCIHINNMRINKLFEHILWYSNFYGYMKHKSVYRFGTENILPIYMHFRV